MMRTPTTGTSDRSHHDEGQDDSDPLEVEQRGVGDVVEVLSCYGIARIEPQEGVGVRKGRSDLAEAPLRDHEVQLGGSIVRIQLERLPVPRIGVLPAAGGEFYIPGGVVRRRIVRRELDGPAR